MNIADSAALPSTDFGDFDDACFRLLSIAASPVYIPAFYARRWLYAELTMTQLRVALPIFIGGL